MNTQIYGGANVSLKNDLSMLHTHWEIPEKNIKGIGDGVICKIREIFHLECNNGSVIPVYMYYAPIVSEMVVIPTDIVTESTQFDNWWQVIQCDNGVGVLRFTSMSGLHSATTPLHMKNKLWYIMQTP